MAKALEITKPKESELIVLSILDDAIEEAFKVGLQIENMFKKGHVSPKKHSEPSINCTCINCQERRQRTRKQALETSYDCELGAAVKSCYGTHCSDKSTLFDLIGSALYSYSDRDSKVCALYHLKCELIEAASEIDKKIGELLKTS